MSDRGFTQGDLDRLATRIANYLVEYVSFTDIEALQKKILRKAQKLAFERLNVPEEKHDLIIQDELPRPSLIRTYLECPRKAGLLEMAKQEERQNIRARETAVVVTASRGKRSKEINNSFDRYPPEDLATFEQTMTDLVQRPFIRTIIFGGATSDDVALRYALRAREAKYGSLVPYDLRFPQFVVVVPMQVRDQPRETWAHTRQADRVVELNERKYDEKGQFRKKVYHIRNEHMLRIAQGFPTCFVQAFWTGQRSHSGTFSTISAARRKKIEVNVAWIGKNRGRSAITMH